MAEWGGRVTEEDGHDHEYKIDEEGNGWTSTDAEHYHFITRYVVIRKQQHVHFIPAVVQGTRIELEHTDVKAEAMRIAITHLLERPDYYDRLEEYVENALTSLDANLTPQNWKPRKRNG